MVPSGVGPWGQTHGVVLLNIAFFVAGEPHGGTAWERTGDTTGDWPLTGMTWNGG